MTKTIKHEEKMHLKLKMLINIESPRSYSTTHIYSLHVFLQGVRLFTRRITITHTCIFYREYLQEEPQINKFIHRVFTSHIYDMYFYREYLFYK